MNVPNNVWEQISELLDLGISLVPVIVIIELVSLIGFIVIFVKVTKFIMKSFREQEEKQKELEREHQKRKEEIEAFRKKHFPNDD